MRNKINSLYTKDNIIVFASMSLLWCVILFVLKQVISISPSAGFSSAVTGAGVAVLAALTATSFALIMHLKKNKISLYTEEIENIGKL
ncbi:MAG: hypothetical protein B6I37_06130 [Desulfobacteraceae bacterium 4572_35.2]|nr:MAG: hypothetical protein B6I37_06130 [Desulfobacteraceae bacterium 4572_35.2]